MTSFSLSQERGKVGRVMRATLVLVEMVPFGLLGHAEEAELAASIAGQMVTGILSVGMQRKSQ
jgi:hypothetical protein